MYVRNRVRCVDMFLEFEQGSELTKCRSDGPTGRTLAQCWLPFLENPRIHLRPWQDASGSVGND